MTAPEDFHTQLQFYMQTEDYMVSQESFELFYHPAYDLLMTLPVPKDLDYYYQSDAYISHTDSRGSFISRLYQGVKKYTLWRKEKLIRSFGLAGKSLLDIGAGTGDFLSVCQKKGWTVCGAEPSAVARAKAAAKNIALESSTSAYPGRQFDVITLWHVLEHVPDLCRQIKELKRLLKPTGKLLVAVPNYKSYDAKCYEAFWAGFDVPRHLWHFSQTAMQKLFAQEDMEIEGTLPMKLDAYYVSLLSEKYKTGKTRLFKAFLTGWHSNFKARRTREYSSLIYIITHHSKG